jgi:hypothetical protein
MEQQEPLLIPDRGVTDVAGDDMPVVDVERPRTHTRLAVLAAVLLPITLLPYYFARRNINQLHKRLNEYAIAIARLQRDSQTTRLENTLKRDNTSMIRRELTEMKEGSRNLSVVMKKDLERLCIEGETQKASQLVSDNVIRSDLQKALDETRRIR